MEKQCREREKKREKEREREKPGEIKRVRKRDILNVNVYLTEKPPNMEIFII